MRIKTDRVVYVLMILFLLCSALVFKIYINQTELCAIVIWLGASSAFIILRHLTNTRSIIFCILFAGFFIRISIIVLEMVLGLQIEHLLNLGDSHAFVDQAVRMLEHEKVNATTKYPYYLKVLFYFFGNNIYIVQLINIVLTTIANYVICETLVYMRINKQAVMIVAIVLSAAPFFVIYNTVVLREALYIYLLSRAFALYVQWIYEKKMSKFVLSCALVLVCAVLHDVYFAVFLAYVMDFSLYLFKRKSGVGLVTMLVMIIVFLSVLKVGRVGYLDYNSLSGALRSIEVVLTRHISAGGNSLYLKSLNYTGKMWQLILYTPIRMVYFFLSPMPWDCVRIKDIVAFVCDSLLHLVFLVQSLILLIAHKRYRIGRMENYREYDRVLVLFCFIIYATALVFAWGTTTAGTAIRHRSSILCIEMALVALITHRRRICVR